MNRVLSICLGFLFCVSSFADDKVLTIKGDKGPGNGRTIVLVAGDEEYRTEESMPMLAKILAKKHGFDCIVLFSWHSSGKYIDPNAQDGVKGWNYLDNADLMLIGTRFRKPNEQERAHITKFLNAGKPVIGIRTSTHAFNGKGSFGGKISMRAFGPAIIGDGWVNHHGAHKKQGCRAVIEEKNADHAILNSVKDIFGPSDVYGIKRLTAANTILLRGQVTETLDPASKAIEGKKNDPMMPLAWLHPYTSPEGTKGTTFTTTMGASVDFVSEDLRRLVVNAAYFLTKLKVPEKADVDYVDPFYPSFYGFTKDKKKWQNLNLQPDDFGLGKSPANPDPAGTPSWPHRPMKK